VFLSYFLVTGLTRRFWCLFLKITFARVCRGQNDMHAIDGRLSEAQSVGGCSPPGEEFAQQRGQLTREMGEKPFSGHIEKISQNAGAIELSLNVLMEYRLTWAVSTMAASCDGVKASCYWTE
jgi:hypothetical protein